MAYVLGEPPRGQSEAFETLERVFSSEEFSQSEALTALEEVLDLSPTEARSALNGLIRSQAIEEV